MQNKTGNLSLYLILLILIFVTVIFYIISVAVKDNYIGKSLNTKPTLILNSTPINLSTPLPIPSTSITPSIATETDCKTDGCSSQYCVSIDAEPTITTCEYREEYSCLKYTTCEKQFSGKCGFTPNTNYTNCLNDLQNQRIGF